MPAVHTANGCLDLSSCVALSILFILVSVMRVAL